MPDQTGRALRLRYLVYQISRWRRISSNKKAVRIFGRIFYVNHAGDYGTMKLTTCEPTGFSPLTTIRPVAVSM